jgi:hypothetical protein
VPRELRKHLDGEITLSDAQLQGHRKRVVAGLGIVRLTAIRQAVERVLAERVGVAELESGAARHAVAMLGYAGVQRRQLRKVIAARLEDDRDLVARHPETRAWLARHPRVDPRILHAGVTTRVTLDKLGEIELAIERDPLEALKLGTYVGSCLGRGGSHAYSAAAAVLDVNKRVVYARDPRGSVLGRQLLAISEADELVCFAVYGAAARALEPTFRAFDRAFAQALGIAVFTMGDDRDYEIASILATEWWNDGALE